MTRSDTTAQEELTHIRTLMEESQRLLGRSWNHQLLWGMVGALGLLATWAAVLRQAHGWTWWIWPVALLMGWIGSFWLGRRHRDRGPVRSVATRAFTGIWVGLGVTLTLLGTVALYTGAVPPPSLPGLLALVFGLGYFATGHVAGMGWLRALALVWWAGGAGLLVWRGPNGILVLAVLVVALEVVPALILRGRRPGHFPQGPGA